MTAWLLPALLAQTVTNLPGSFVTLLQDDAARKLIEQLDSKSAEAREETTKQLRAMGQAARPALEAAVHGTKPVMPDCRDRARPLLDELYVKLGEETLGKIEAAALGAKTLQVRFKTVVRPDPRGSHPGCQVAGTILFKDGNKVRMEATTVQGGRSIERLVVSDGATTAYRGDGEKQAYATPEILRSRLTSTLVRAGGLFCAVGVDASSAKGWEKVEPKVTFPAARPAPLDPQGLQPLRFTVEGGRAVDVWQVTLSFDPKTFRLVKREIQMPENQGRWTQVTETVEEYAVDVDLPDGRFELPK